MTQRKGKPEDESYRGWALALLVTAASVALLTVAAVIVATLLTATPMGGATQMRPSAHNEASK